MENEVVATNGGEGLSQDEAEKLLAGFDPSYQSKKQDFVSEEQESQLTYILTHPDEIDALDDDVADAMYAEGNRIFCKGGYDYMMPNSTHDAGGKQFDGVVNAQTRQWTSKAGLKQMAHDIVYMNAAFQGVDALGQLLNGQHGKRIGMTAEQYASATFREKAKAFKDNGVIKTTQGWKAGMANWWDSWDLYSSTHGKQAKDKENLLKYGPEADVSYESCRWDWNDVDAEVKKKIADEAVAEAVKFGFHSQRRNLETGAIEKTDVDYKDAKAFAEAVWDSPNHVFKSQTGDIFSALPSKDGYRLELARGGVTENCYRVCGIAESQNVNERNALNAIAMREMFNTNPELLKWYRQYDNSRKDNALGMFNRKGDVTKLLNDFMEDFRPYAKNDSELTPEEIEIRDRKQLTFQQLCECLAMDDHREGFRHIGGAMSRFFAGVGNTVLDFGYELGGLFSNSVHGYGKMFDAVVSDDSEKSYFDRFKEWAEEDLRSVTASELYDQGTIAGFIGGEAAKLFAFSALTKAGTVGRFANITGKGVNASGRALKLAGLEGFGQKVKSIGAAIQRSGRAAGGGTTVVMKDGTKGTVGFRQIDVPANGKLPKGAVKIGDNYFVKDIQRAKVGNFMQEHNARAAKFEKDLENAVAQRKEMAAQLGGKIGNEAALDEAFGKVYADIDKMESEIAKSVGSHYGAASQWVADIVNELPSVMTVSAAMYDSHLATGAYKIGEGFIEYDENGNPVRAKFNPDEWDVVKEYSVYDAAGNAVFLFKLNKLMKGILDGRLGTQRIQQSFRNWYGKVMELQQRGEYNMASGLVAMLDNGFRRKGAEAAHLFATGAGMAVTSTIVGNAEDIALKRLRDPEYQASIQEYLVQPEQALGVLKSGFGMMVGGLAAGALSGAAGEVKNGQVPLLTKFNQLRQMKELDALTRDTWAIAAGIAHRKGKNGIKYDELSTDPVIATRQAREQMMRDEEAYRDVSDKTTKFISRVITSEAARLSGLKPTEGMDVIREDMRKEFGETYVRVMDGIMEHVRRVNPLRAEFGYEWMRQNIENQVRTRKEAGFAEFSKHAKETMKGIEDSLGVKGRRPKMRGDGSFLLNFDVDGKNGWLNLEFKSGDTMKAAKIADGQFDKGWAADVMNGLLGKDETFDEEHYGDLKREVAALDATLQELLKNGSDHNGILERAYERICDLGSNTGFFSVTADGKKLATMSNTDGRLTITDFAHETVHGIIETLRDRGYFKARDGSDTEQMLREKYGDAWEEDFIRDLLTGRQELEANALARDGISKLDEGGAFSKLLNGIKKAVMLPSELISASKPKRSYVESALDKFIEDAKTAHQEAVIDEKATEIGEDIGENTPKAEAVGGPIVVSTMPVPNEIFVGGLKGDELEARKRELNNSGFYYDSQHDVWVNEKSAPTLYHRAVNEVIAQKQSRQMTNIKEAFRLVNTLSKFEAEMLKQTEKLAKIRKLVTPEEFTESERKHMGILLADNGEPLGIVNANDGLLIDIDGGYSLVNGKNFPAGSRIVPYQHDLHRRWNVKAVANNSKLIAPHCLPPEWAIKMLEEGASAGLSLGVQPKGQLHNNAFGAVTFLFGKKSVDLKVKDADGRFKNYMFNIDMGLPVWGDIHNVDANGNVLRNRMQGKDQEWAVATNPDGSLVKYETIPEVAEGFAQWMDYDYEKYPSPLAKKARVKNIEKLRASINADGELPNLYAEAKLARLVEAGEIIGVSIPRFSDAYKAKHSQKVEELDKVAVAAVAKKLGVGVDMFETILKKKLASGEYLSQEFEGKPLHEVVVKSVDAQDGFFSSLDRIAELCERRGIPVDYWDGDGIEFGMANRGGGLDAQELRVASIDRLAEKRPEILFNVIGKRGAARYFGKAWNEVNEQIRVIVEDAITATDDGTRVGLKSSKNANINDWLASRANNRFGPFVLHIGGTDGDKKPRLEYAGKKPKMPQAFLKRAKDGEAFHVYDIMGNAVRQDEVLAKAYPEIMNAEVVFSGTKGVKEPAWLDDKTFILANEDGKIVINRDRYDELLAPEQFAQSLVGLIQKAEGWEERLRESDVKVAEALQPTRAKRMNSRMSFWLSDPRFIATVKEGERIIPVAGKLVERALRERLGDKYDDAVLRKVGSVIFESIKNSVKDFAGEAEAKFLASRYGMKAEQLMDYSEAEKVLRDTLVTLDSDLTSVQQTKKNIAYWENVIGKAIDLCLFGKKRNDLTHKDRKREATIRPELREAIADEMTEAIIERILEGTRAVRTQTEAKMSGVGVGEKAERVLNLNEAGASQGEEVEGSEPVSEESTAGRLAAGFAMMRDDAAWDESSGGRTLATSGMTVVSSVDAGMTSAAKSLDAKWERNKGAVAKAVADEIAKIRETLRKDPSKAASIQYKLMDKLNKLVAENCSTYDPIVQKSMLNEAISMCGSKFRVVGSRRTPQELTVQAASVKLAKEFMAGRRDNAVEKVQKWVEEQSYRIGIINAKRTAFVSDVMVAAVPVAERLTARFKGTDDDVSLIRESERETAVQTLTDKILRGAVGGYNLGSSGEDAASRAVREAKRIQVREVKNARGMGLNELNGLLGGDIVKDIESIGTTFGDGNALATKAIKAFSDKLRTTDSRFLDMTEDEFEQSEVARAELASTVAAWLQETSRRLGWGQVREWSMREAARLQKTPQTFASIHMTMAKHADRLASSIGQESVNKLLDEVDKSIDKYADGDRVAAMNVPNYDRKVAPRLQDYWKYVKQVMRMTEAAVEKEIAKYNNELKLSDMQLLELGEKDANDIEAAEEGLIARDRAMMRLNALTRFGAMKHKSYAECRDIIDAQLTHDLAGSIQRQMILKNARLEDDARVRQALIGELTSIRNAKKGKFDLPDNGTAGGNMLAFSVADLFKRMQIYLHEGTEAWNFIDQFRQDMSLANIDKTMFVSNWEGEMRKACQQIYGVNFERLVLDMMVKNPAYDEFSRSGWYIPENGKTVEVNVGGRVKKVVLAKQGDGSVKTNLPNHLSKANLIYIYAACQQADMQVNNAIWGRDAEYLRKIEDIIGPEGVAMAGWLTKAYGEIRKRISPISEEITGMPVLSPDERYCPLSFTQDQVSNDERRFASSPYPAFLTRRVTHDSLRLNEQCDAFRMFEDKIQDAGHYLGFAKIIDRMNTTLKHPKVQTAFAQLYGTKAKNDIYAQLADALNGGRKNSDTLLCGVRNFVTATSLFGNVGSAMKQLEGIGGWAVEMGVGEWVRGLVRNPATSREVRDGLRELIEAGLFQTREEEGISEAMVSLMNSCDGVPAGPMSKTYRWYKRHGMDVTKFVDKIASMSMAGQYYVGRKNFYIENGVREEDAKRKALADTDYAIQTTQQSGRPEFLHSAQRAGTAGKMLTQFSGPAFVRWGIECETLHRAVVMGDKGAWSRLASRLIALHLICPSILTLAGGISSVIFRREDQKMKDLVDQTKKDIVANCITGPMSGWFIWGQIINAFAYENVIPDVKGMSSKTHFEAPVLSKLHSLQQMTSKMYKDVVKAAPWDRFTKAERNLIREDTWRIFQMLFPVTRTANALNMVK